MEEFSLNDSDERQRKERAQAALSLVPITADIRWENVNGLTVIFLKKNFSKFESFLHKVFGGPDTVRIPLDKYGTDVWALCDGKHTVKQICDALWEKYREEMEGVDGRVPQFIATLRARGLIYFEHEKPNIVQPNAEKAEMKR